MKKFSKQKLAIFLAAAIAVSAGLSAIAATVTKQITVQYLGTKIVVDGNPVTPTDANGKAVEPFVSEGTTYLPVRAIANALGKEVSYDAATGTVYIGSKPGEKTRLIDAKKVDSTNIYDVGISDQDNFGNRYTHGLKFYRDNSRINYALNGNYKKLTATVAPYSDSTNNTLKFYSVSDENTVLLYETQNVGAGTAPFKIEVDLTGVNVLIISVSGDVYFPCLFLANAMLE